MKISKWWFRTRKDQGTQRTLISLEHKKKYKIRCSCDRCFKEFNRQEEVGNFSLCASCMTADRNCTPESRERSSRVFKKYYSSQENRDKHSYLASSRYSNPEYAEQHKIACQERSDNPEYRQKLSDNAARGELHAIKTSCGKRKIKIEDFDDFVTILDIREREKCKTTVSKECLQKANYICQICNKGNNLCAHHLDGWNWAIDKRFDIDNLVCLCHGCHSQFHKEFGKGGNTRVQFDEYYSRKSHKHQ